MLIWQWAVICLGGLLVLAVMVAWQLYTELQEAYDTGYEDALRRAEEDRKDRRATNRANGG